MEPDILKSGAIILRNKKLLITKPKKNDFWIFVGGKVNPGETMEESLRREVREELAVDVVGRPIPYLKSPLEPAAGDENKTVQIFAYLVEIDSKPQASSEIEDIYWLSREEFEANKFKLGSILQKYTIPQLIADGKM